MVSCVEKVLKYSIFFSLESASDEQKKDFLDEIKLMKFIGVHTNIVNMLGCRTTIEPLYLVVELVRFGDMLNFLRNRREQVRLTLPSPQLNRLFVSWKAVSAVLCLSVYLEAREGEEKHIHAFHDITLTLTLVDQPNIKNINKKGMV